MSELAKWYVTRLRMLAEGPRTYTATDTVNPVLVRQGLIIDTGRDLSRSRREYAITEAGRAVLHDRMACSSAKAS